MKTLYEPILDKFWFLRRFIRNPLKYYEMMIVVNRHWLPKTTESYNFMSKLAEEDPKFKKDMLTGAYRDMRLAEQRLRTSLLRMQRMRRILGRLRAIKGWLCDPCNDFEIERLLASKYDYYESMSGRKRH